MYMNQFSLELYSQGCSWPKWQNPPRTREMTRHSGHLLVQWPFLTKGFFGKFRSAGQYMWFFPIVHPSRDYDEIPTDNPGQAELLPASSRLWTLGVQHTLFFFFFSPENVEPRSRKEGSTLAMKVFMTQQKGRNRKASSQFLRLWQLFLSAFPFLD